MSATPRAGAIFLVDDDPDFLELNRRVLESGGFGTACYSDPQSALEAMGKTKPLLVISDLMMKALDSGFTLARTIKSNPELSAVPVIIVTAVSSQKGFDFKPRSREDLAAMGADAYFDKPVSPEALIAKVKELLG
jgi:CheY-like chemotaxis protein